MCCRVAGWPSSNTSRQGGRAGADRYTKTNSTAASTAANYINKPFAGAHATVLEQQLHRYLVGGADPLGPSVLAASDGITPDGVSVFVGDAAVQQHSYKA